MQLELLLSRFASALLRSVICWPVRCILRRHYLLTKINRACVARRCTGQTSGVAEFGTSHPRAAVAEWASSHFDPRSSERHADRFVSVVILSFLLSVCFLCVFAWQMRRWQQVDSGESAGVNRVGSFVARDPRTLREFGGTDRGRGSGIALLMQLLGKTE